MWRIVDIGGYGYSLKCSDNKLVVCNDGKSTEVPFRDINSIVIHGECQISSHVFNQCIDNCIPITFCDSKHLPAGLFSSFFQNLESARRFEVQMKASRPRMKQAWAQIIREKIRNQSHVLNLAGYGLEAGDLYAISTEVLSGDSTNREAVGARLYFSTLLGNEFSRNNSDIGINEVFDYGYSIIRSLVARSVSAIGLHPGMSVFHSNRINPFALVDDLMEPLRPFVDLMILGLLREGAVYLNPEVKRNLISIISLKTPVTGKVYELRDAVQIMVMSYVDFLDGKVTELVFPQLDGVCL